MSTDELAQLVQQERCDCGTIYPSSPLPVETMTGNVPVNTAPVETIPPSLSERIGDALHVVADRVYSVVTGPWSPWIVGAVLLLIILPLLLKRRKDVVVKADKAYVQTRRERPHFPKKS